jgi:Fur family peroxide stress response transcriptional regulator
MSPHLDDRRSGLEDYEAVFRRHGVPLTVQRRVILEALLGRDDHPTADLIYEQVRDRIPGVSRTTVYRVMETLARLGIAHRVSHPGAAARFDGWRERHDHLVCIYCDKILDLEDPVLDKLKLPERYRAGAELAGFEITDHSIYLRGCCPECRRQRAGEAVPE